MNDEKAQNFDSWKFGVKCN